MAKEPKVKITRKRGRTLTLEFDYGKVIHVTFPSDRSENEIKEEIKALYNKYKAQPKKIEIDKLDWKDE